MKSVFLILMAIMLAINVNAKEFEEVNEVVNTTIVSFSTASATLNNTAKRTLSKVKIAPSSEVVIVGKTDMRGDEVSNVKLGMRRAETVANYLNVTDASVSSVGEADAKETDPAKMFMDRIVMVKVIDKEIVFNPVFGDALMQLQGPLHNLQYNTIPLGQGAKRTQQPRM